MNRVVSLWLKRIASIIGAFYAYCICRLAYYSFYYDISVTSRPATAVAATGISLVAIVLMVYSRKQVLTIISALVMIPALIPVTLLFYGHWEIIIPAVIAAVSVFLLSGMKEGIKTAIGIIYLVFWIIGTLAAFIVSTVFATNVDRKLIDAKVSPSGEYRYEIYDTSDSSNGSTEVHIEPNTYDENFGLVKFTMKGYDRTVYVERPVAKKIDAEWKTESRNDIVKKLDSISEEIELNLSTEQKAELGKSKDENVYLSKLSSEDFRKLGVAEEGDVLYIDDKPVFRYCVAQFEDYFCDSNKEMNLFE